MHDTVSQKKAEQDSVRFRDRLNPRVVSSLLDDLSSGMSERYREQAKMLRKVEAAVREAAAEASGMTLFWLIVVGREVYGRWRRCPSSTLAKELGIVRHKWIVRGLGPDVVERVEKAVLGELNEGRTGQ